jgi:glycerol-3-phosphate dehydrogenase
MNRNTYLNSLNKKFDLIVIGGGISGAGILLRAAQMGFSCLLLEKNDFASGTSSRSGKLVHGGLRYLRQGQIRTTVRSVKERERMLAHYKGLVKPLNFMVPLERRDIFGRALIKTGLTIYDTLAMRRNHHFVNQDNFRMVVPAFDRRKDMVGYRFLDALTDDARLVLEVIKEAIDEGAMALNYCEVLDYVKDSKEKVCGVIAADKLNAEEFEIESKVVINATGAWAGMMHGKIKERQRLRLLRGSHILFPRWRFPVPEAISVIHPEDKRPLYILPWMGATILGTTDVDCELSLNNEPGISHDEAEYLIAAVEHHFPSLGLAAADAVSTMAGIRAVIDTGKKNPSKESREHALWTDQGLITITGGKLTAFKHIAISALKEAKKQMNAPAVKENKSTSGSGGSQDMLGNRDKGSGVLDNQFIGNTGISWQHLIDASKHEQVSNLSDLLIRRTRVGVLSPNGARDILDDIQLKAEPYLDWDWPRMRDEYLSTWNNFYSPDLCGN